VVSIRTFLYPTTGSSWNFPLSFECVRFGRIIYGAPKRGTNDEIETTRRAYGVYGLEGVALAILAGKCFSRTGRSGVQSPMSQVRFETHRNHRKLPVDTPLQLLTEFESNQEEPAARFSKQLVSQCVRNRVTRGNFDAFLCWESGIR
jgi:hypothetical protein